MKWKKLGQLYDPRPVHPKLATHAANPLPILLDGNIYRVFFSGRDAQNRSSIGFVDVDIIERKVVYVHDQPIFIHSSEGSFYSHGVSIGNCYETNGKKYMLFMGWQCPQSAHWRGDIGRLVFGNDFSLRLDNAAPFMASDIVDPISLSYPWVMRDKKGLYRMWYGSTLSWNAGNGEMLHVINYATSIDGHHWVKHGQAIPHELGVAQAFSRPTVIVNNNGYHMWFSYRSGNGVPYRIGYAFSADGAKWEIYLNKAGIDISVAGWDSEMIEYPFVFEHNSKHYMLYNGNSHGKTGFGLAVQEG